MSDQSTARHPSLVPHLICADAYAAIEFYKRAFGAEVQFEMPGPDGKLMHASLEINGGVIMLAEENLEQGCLTQGPKTLGGTPVSIHLQVDDADGWFDRAVKAGATAVMPVADMFWGDRYGVVDDPYGHRWSVATQVRQLSQDEIEQGMQEFMKQQA